MAFFSKADAKVRLIFELPKLFRSFFSKSFFWSGKFKTPSLFSISTRLRFSLESGCKITALQHILQTYGTLFCKLFASFHLTHWFPKDAVEHVLKTTIQANKSYTLLLYIRTHTPKNHKTTWYFNQKSPTLEHESHFTSHPQTAPFTIYTLPGNHKTKNPPKFRLTRTTDKRRKPQRPHQQNNREKRKENLRSRYTKKDDPNWNHLYRWALTDSNRRPSACKADALNQLS